MDNNGFDKSLENIKTISKFHHHDLISNSDVQSSKYTFEEAISFIGVGKFHYILLAVCGICVTSFITETLGISLVMASAKCDLNFTIYEQGILASAGFLGVVLSSHTVGFLSDTRGRIFTLKYSIIVATICSIISAFSTSVWMFIVMRFLVGIFVNPCQSCLFSYMGEFHSNKTKPKYITLLAIFFALSVVYSPALAIAFLPQEYDYYLGSMKFSSWRVTLLIFSSLTFIASIALPFFPESPKFLLVRGQHDESLAVLRKIYKCNTGKDEASYPVQFITSNEDSPVDLSKINSIGDAIRTIWMQTIPLFSKERRWVTINLGINQFVIFFVCHGSFMWVPEILKPIVEYSSSNWTVCDSIRLYNIELKQLNADISNDIELECSPSKRVDIFVLQMLVILGIAFSFLYLVFAFIINLIGKQRLLLIWMLICGPPILALIWSKGFILNLVLVFFYMLYGNCAGLITSITNGFYPTNINGMAMCLVMMMGRLGSFIGSNVIGILLYQNCEYLFVLLSLMVGLLYILLYFLPSDKKLII